MELVKIRWDKISCTSREIADAFWKEHKNILKSIEKLLEEEKEDKSFVANFQATNYKKRWKFEKEYLINKDWFTFLVMWFTWKKAREFKKKYINAFNILEKKVNWLYIQQQSEQFKIERQNWIKTRRTFTTALQDLEKYAKIENPNATTKFIYSRYTSEINKTLFEVEWKFKNVRNYCTTSQITRLNTIEEELTWIIYQEMEKGTLWKEIYYIVKEKLKIISEFFAKTKIISVEQLKLS